MSAAVSLVLIFLLVSNQKCQILSDSQQLLARHIETKDLIWNHLGSAILRYIRILLTRKQGNYGFQYSVLKLFLSSTTLLFCPMDLQCKYDCKMDNFNIFAGIWSVLSLYWDSWSRDLVRRMRCGSRNSRSTPPSRRYPLQSVSDLCDWEIL